MSIDFARRKGAVFPKPVGVNKKSYYAKHRFKLKNIYSQISLICIIFVKRSSSNEFKIHCNNYIHGDKTGFWKIIHFPGDWLLWRSLINVVHVCVVFSIREIICITCRRLVTSYFGRVPKSLCGAHNTVNLVENVSHLSFPSQLTFKF